MWRTAAGAGAAREQRPPGTALCPLGPRASAAPSGCWAKRLRSERGPDPGVAYLNGACSSFVNKRLLDLGLPAEVCRDLLNPGFEDPFGPETPTLEPEFMKLWGYPLMNGKLDWMLLRRAGVVWKGLGNHDYSLSDHKWLAATIELQQRNS
uniref:Uncharacterized protein n=1 Tax=Tetraselmis sp. GSL018 TaxID=582737 RepID=A0A061RUK4_9CHLO